MGKIINWRKATEEEITNGLDHPVNKGMFLVSEETFEDVPSEPLPDIDIKSLSDSQILELAERIKLLS